MDLQVIQSKIYEMRGRKVERNCMSSQIVMPFDQGSKHRTVAGKNLKGCLKRYAKSGLPEKEQSAWEDHIVEKYLNTL